jgi:hypothetical protein
MTKDHLQIENKMLFLFAYEKERQMGPHTGKPTGALVITQISPRAICY